jgi:polyhydroxybutyrate depolymerase
MRNIAAILVPTLILAAAGCTEPKSTAASKRVSENTALGSAKSSATRRKGKALSAPKYSDGCETPALAPGVRYLSLEYGGWRRSYVMTVPDSASEQSPAHPMLIAMHGFGGNGRGMRDMIGHDHGLEDERVVVYPDGAGRTNSVRGWNSGHPRCCGTALDDDVDDVAFLRALVQAVAQETCIDLNRVYATGFSNGGDMAQRLACDASDVVAAVTSVAGRFGYHSRVCPGERPVPAVLYRGLRDGTVPYEGELMGLGALKTIPATEGFDNIARNHGCTVIPVNTLSVDDTDCLRIDDCDGGFEITLCTSAGAGHCWPGLSYCPQTRNGNAEAFSASDHMQSFFARHALSP